MHGDKCTGASAAVRAETQGPLGERRIKAKSSGSASHDVPPAAACTGASAVVRAKTIGPLGERRIRQNH